jgi:tRNA modification GTPase
MYALDDNIAAVASAPGGAPRGIVRATGPQIVACLARCFQPKDGAIDLAAMRKAAVLPGTISLAGFTTPLECDVYLWPNTRSYTRAPAAEIHTFGSPPILEAVLAALCAAGARPARPGEFTLRAFLAGRIDLTQAEAVLGVIDAASERDFNRALEQLAGGLAGPLGRLRSELLDLLAQLEAGLDFVEEDIEFITAAEMERQLTEAAQQVAQLAARMQSRGEAAESARAVLVGWPNVGKSSLFNALAGRDAAIVSHLAGTTRDYLVARLDLDGVVCELIDTAGVEPNALREDIPQAAQASTAEQWRQAHVELFCLDATRAPNDWERQQLLHKPAGQRLIVWTKTDLHDCRDEALSAVDEDACRTSSASGAGLSALRERLRTAIVDRGASDCQVVVATAERSRESLRLAAECLERARETVTGGGGEELVAAEVRTALSALGDVVGTVYTDDILDRIFSRFCIGK